MAQILRKNFCGAFYLRKPIFADRWKNRKIKKRGNFEPNGIFQALIAKLFDPKENENYAVFFFFINC